MTSSRRHFLKLASGALAAGALPWRGFAALDSSPAARKADPRFRCLFNHELLIVCGKEDNSPAYIGSFIDKLAGTDVDAVMCCPGAWRTNLFPSRVDPLEKNYRPGQTSPKFPGFARIMSYIHAGGDPVRDTLAACRRAGKAFFISYRMNDHHYLSDKEWPTHNAIWREHPEYWLGDSDDSPYSGSDNVRLFNYRLPEVREYYFSIIEELCRNYDLDGLELDFQRYPKFFRQEDLAAGRGIMTDFIRRLKALLVTLGRERGKTLPLSIRIPETLAKCDRAGLEIAAWDREGLVEMVNVSSFYKHTIELGIEGFKSALSYGRIYGEMNYVTLQSAREGKGFYRRYTTPEIYRASAANLFARGVDGLSLFNFDYVPAEARLPMTETLKRITDVPFLQTCAKDYALYAGFAALPARDAKTFELVVADDPASPSLKRIRLRVETKQPSTDLTVHAWLNDIPLVPESADHTELFGAVDRNPAYPQADVLKFFAVPHSALRQGTNRLRVENADHAKHSCDFISLELALYR